MESRDILYAAAALAALLILAIAGAVLAAVALAAASPLALLGAIGAMGIFGLFILAGLIAAFVSAWYVIYALIRGAFSPPGPPSKKRDYSLSRIRRS